MKLQKNNYNFLIDNIDKILEEGRKKASLLAKETMQEVMKAICLTR